MNPDRIQQCLSKLDGRGSDDEFAAVQELAQLGSQFPEVLLAAYRSSRNWSNRTSYVYHATKYSRSSDAAFALGIEALSDRSKYVRYRACKLLAVAQRDEAIEPLRSLLSDPDSNEDAAAAIDAIEHKNHNLFLDRDHSGKVTLNIPFVDVGSTTNDC